MAEGDLLDRLPAMGSQPFELPQEYTQLAGTPGVGVVGNRAFRVGVQDWSPEQAAAYEQRQQATRMAAEAEVQRYRDQQQQQWLMEQIKLSGKVDQQIKAIQQYRQFSEMRAVAREVEQLTAGGKMTAAEAYNLVVPRHLEAFGTQLPAVMRAAQPPATPFVPTEQVMGGVPGVRHGRYGESWTPIRPPTTGLSAADRAMLSMEMRELQNELKNAALVQLMPAGPEKDAALADVTQKKSRLAEIQDQLRSENISAADRRGVISAPATAAPAAAVTGAHYTWDPQNKLRRVR